MKGKKARVWVLCELLPWTWTEYNAIAGNLPFVGGGRCGRHTSDSAPARMCLLPKSVTECSVKACFGSGASVIRLSYNSAAEVSHFLDTISSRSCLVILVCLAQRRCFLVLVAGGERCKRGAAGAGRWVRTGHRWAPGKGSVEKAFVVGNHEVARSQLTERRTGLRPKPRLLGRGEEAA